MSAMNYKTPEDYWSHVIAYSDEQNKIMKTLNKLFKAMKRAILEDFLKKSGS